MSSHTIRHKDGGTVEIGKYSPQRAIRAFCVECMGFDAVGVQDCTDPRCPLFPFRGTFSRSVTRFIRAPLTDEQRERQSERLRVAREGQKRQRIPITPASVNGDLPPVGVGTPVE